MEEWKLLYGERVYDLSYETLTQEQGKQTRLLLSYLGLQWEEACLAPEDNIRSVNTASSIQVRRKVYQDSSLSWENYKSYIGQSFSSLN